MVFFCGSLNICVAAAAEAALLAALLETSFRIKEQTWQNINIFELRSDVFVVQFKDSCFKVNKTANIPEKY